MENRSNVEIVVRNRMLAKYQDRYAFMNCETIGYISKKKENVISEPMIKDTDFSLSDFDRNE